MKKGRKAGLIKNSNLPKALGGRIPFSDTFTKSDPTSEELRKMIILLYSYRFWVDNDYEYDVLEYDDYLEKLNDYLRTARLQEMYPGNPFDWLFMYCTIKGFNEDKVYSLDAFRSIISEALIFEGN